MLTTFPFIPCRTKPKQRKPYCQNKTGFLLLPVGSWHPHTAVRSRAVSRRQNDQTCHRLQRQWCGSSCLELLVLPWRSGAPAGALRKSVHLFQSSRGLHSGLRQKCFYWMLGILTIGSGTPATSRTPLSAPEAAKEGATWLTGLFTHDKSLKLRRPRPLLASARVFWVAVVLGGTGSCEQAWDAEPTTRTRPPFSTVSWQHVLPFMNSCKCCYVYQFLIKIISLEQLLLLYLVIEANSYLSEWLDQVLLVSWFLRQSCSVTHTCLELAR